MQNGVNDHKTWLSGAVHICRKCFTTFIENALRVQGDCRHIEGMYSLEWFFK